MSTPARDFCVRVFRFGPAAVVSAVLVVSAALAEGAPPPADRVFTLAVTRAPQRAEGPAASVTGPEAGVLSLAWTIAPGNYLYRDSLHAAIDGRDLPLATGTGETKDDPNFGEVEVFHGRVEARIADAPATGRLTVSARGCAEQGICYPPVTKTIDLATLAVIDAPTAGFATGEATPSPAGPTAFAEVPPAGVEDPDSAAPAVASTRDAGTDMGGTGALLHGDPLAMIAAFLGFGLLLAFTPCVFPMIPILSAMLAGAGERLSAGRGFALSAAYVTAMAGAYGAVGLVAGWTGANLQAALQTPWALGAAGVVFAALGLSMFGLFDLALPARFAARLAGIGGGGRGSVAGAAVLGFGSALVVGPCVTPPLAAAMLYAVKTGEAARGAAALAALGFGMGLPLIAVGTFGAHVLPKSGRWLDRVRPLFGAVFLGVAAMFAARLLPAPAGLALWGLLALAAGALLGGFDQLDNASGRPARLGKAAGVAAIVYGAVLIVGAAGGSDDPLRPLGFVAADRGTSEGGAAEGRAAAAASRERVASPVAFERAVAAARAAGRPVLVSFTAAWCTVCKANEAVMATPALRRRLAALPTIVADVTAYGPDTRALMARFDVVGPPTLFLVDPSGREVPGSRRTGPVTADDLDRLIAEAGV